MEIYKFSKEWIVSQSLSRPKKRTEYRDAENRYLRLVVHPTGHAKLCIYKCMQGERKATRVSLPFTVNDQLPSMQRIRKEANKIILKLDEGINPNHEKNHRLKHITLQQALDNHLAGSTNTDRVNHNCQTAIETHLAYWLTRKMSDLCTPKIIFNAHRSIMKNMATTNQKQNRPGNGGIGANEVMKKLRRILNFNRALDRNAGLPHWPTEELGPSGLDMWIQQKPRTRRVHKEELPMFLEALESIQDTLQRNLFFFYLLTGTRNAEARNLKRKDVNFARNAFTLRNTKNGNDHTLPLTPTLRKLVVESMKLSDSDLVFPLYDPKAVTKHIKRECGLRISPQDLRRTLAGIAEITGIGSTTKKDILNHLSGRDVTDDYTGSSDIDHLRDSLVAIEDKIINLSKNST